MKLSISNISWADKHDLTLYEFMKTYGFSGLEIAPTRVFPNKPYDMLTDAAKWARQIKDKYGFEISSMQSIWFGREEKLFGSKKEREILMDYTKKAIDFAEVIDCKNLVFGCPRNRVVPDGINQEEAICFFKYVGDYAAAHGTAIGMEANPPIYNTNYINNTKDALDLIEFVNSKGFCLNLDAGTMIYNAEDVEILADKIKFVNHVHISEPGLQIIEKRTLHKELKNLLETERYDGFISIEMGKTENLADIKNVMKYVMDIFG